MRDTTPTPAPIPAEAVQVADLLVALADDISETRAWANELREELGRAEQKLTDLQVETKAIDNAMARYGLAGPRALVDTDPAWPTLTRVDAIERALRESGPLHLNEIRSYLVRRGCEPSSIGAISATLTNLHQHRESVVNVGKGRWDYVGGTEGTNPSIGDTAPPVQDEPPLEPEMPPEQGLCPPETVTPEA